MMLSHAAAGLMCAVLANSPVEYLVVDQVDVIEVNHCHDEEGKHVFDQIIFYDWSPANRRYQVRAWRLLKEKSQYPRRNVRQGGYEALWRDGLVLRHVHATTYRETWTRFDPELAARQHLRKEDRRQLTSPDVATASGGISRDLASTRVRDRPDRAGHVAAVGE